MLFLHKRKRIKKSIQYWPLWDSTFNNAFGGMTWKLYILLPFMQIAGCKFEIEMVSNAFFKSVNTPIVYSLFLLLKCLLLSLPLPRLLIGLTENQIDSTTCFFQWKQWYWSIVVEGLFVACLMSWDNFSSFQTLWQNTCFKGAINTIPCNLTPTKIFGNGLKF